MLAELTRRMGYVFAVLCGVLAGYALWKVEADRILGAKVDAIIATGEPFRPSDFERPPPPGDENAAEVLTGLLNDALAKHPIQAYELGRWLEDPEGFLTVRDDGFAPVDVLIELAPIFESACSRRQCFWGTRYRSPLGDTYQGFLHEQARINQAFNVLARETACRGEYPIAVRLMEALLFHAEFIAGEPGPLGAWLEPKIEPITLESLRALVPSIARMDATTRLHLRRVNSRLADESTALRRLAGAMHFQRALAYDQFVVAPYQIGDKLRRTSALLESSWLEPLRKFDAVWAFEYIDQHISAFTAPTLEAAIPLVPVPVELDFWTALRHPYAATVLPYYCTAVEAHHDRLALRRRVSREIAAQLFEADHGRPPATIEELVPAYLPRLNPEPMGGW